MALELTPIDKDLIFNHLPVQLEPNLCSGLESSRTPGEKTVFEELEEKQAGEENPEKKVRLEKLLEECRKWAEKVEKEDSHGQRVEVARMLHGVLEKNLGGSLWGVAEKRDAFKRLETLYTIASLPKEIQFNESKVKKIMASDEHEKLLRDSLSEILKSIIPLEKEIKEEKALKNMEYLSNLFKYHAGYKNNRNHLELFQAIHKAFLEDGVEGVKKLKYHNEEFKDVLDEETKKFAEELDERLGEVTAGGASSGKFDLYEVFKGKLGDFQQHAEQEKLDEALKDALKKAESDVQTIANNLKGALNESGDATLSELSGLVENLVEKRDFNGLRNEAEKLMGKKFEKEKLEKTRNFAIGNLNRLADKIGILVNQEELSKAIAVGKEIAAGFANLKDMPLEDQYKTLSNLERKFGRENLEKHEKRLASLGKANFMDLRYFVKQVLEPPQKPSGETVKARIVHDASLLFTLGKFENNCQSPGVQQSQSLLGFTAHPSELTIGFFDEDGEFIGFSFAHFLKHGEGHALAIERPYSNHGNLKPVMNKLLEEIAKKIDVLASEKRLELKAFLSKNKPSGLDLKVLASPFVSKWYDVKGGEVHGGEKI